MVNESLAMLMSDSRCIEFWDLRKKICVKRFFTEVVSEISCAIIFHSRTKYLTLGFGDEAPKILSYRLDTWQRYSSNVSHTKKIAKLLQYGSKHLISGSSDGNICIHEFSHLKTIHQSPHISSIEDIILKNTYLYVLLKCSTVCEYEVIEHEEN